ncbi:hypothetical protein MHU86_25686 [Fragilaria crotonensis]|nr:hypothetical protein MHU86_25686 [Fragilaria crotonensis]
MGALLQCIRSCLDNKDNNSNTINNHGHDDNGNYDPSDETSQAHVSMDRAVVAASSTEQHEEDRHICCNPSPPPWAQFWRNLHKQNYQHLETETHVMVEYPSSPLFGDTDSEPSMRKYSTSSASINKSPLRTAETFDSSRDILTIRMEEIVLPGSALQQAMATKMCESIEQQAGDECVICMEAFSQDNPRMPTLCGCGTNRTYFHLPCLYQWKEQSQECPSCRQLITWEEL